MIDLKAIQKLMEDNFFTCSGLVPQDTPETSFSIEDLRKAMDEIISIEEAPWRELFKEHGFDIDKGDILFLPKKYHAQIPKGLKDNIKTNQWIGEMVFINGKELLSPFSAIGYIGT